MFLMHLLCTWVTCLPKYTADALGAFMCLCDSNFLMIVCFESKRTSIRRLCVTQAHLFLMLSVVYLGDLFTQVHNR